MTLRLAPVRPERSRVASSGRLPGLAAVSLLLAAGGLGCYRATGYSAPVTVAEQVPAAGGERVGGMKATAGPGDYVLGNDYIRIAVDGSTFGSGTGQFGAYSGGSILDVGGVGLDTAFKQVPLPTDSLERLTPVANQDPDLPLVFDSYVVSNSNDASILTMTGYLLDPLHKLPGASWDSSDRVLGIKVVHRISLNTRDGFVTLDTTLTNQGASPLPLVSLGDYLAQRGGGFRFVVPASKDASGASLSTWGLDIPGSDFTNPLGTSVQAPMVVLQGAEPSAEDLDSHESLGILPADSDEVLVASDPQQVLGQPRPMNPARLVVGSVPTASALAPNGQLKYSRILALSAGTSQAGGTQNPNSIFNFLQFKRASLRGIKLGRLIFQTGDAAAKTGSRNTEIRFERYTGTSLTPDTDSDPTHWVLEALSIPEAGENPDLTGAPETVLLPVQPDPADATKNSVYRIVLKDGSHSETDYFLWDINNPVSEVTPTYLRPAASGSIVVEPTLSTERTLTTQPNGSRIYYPIRTNYFSVRAAGDFTTGINRALMPARITVEGLTSSGTPDSTLDPTLKRVRQMTSYFSAVLHDKALIQGLDPGSYHFIGGNQGFGVNLLTSTNPIPMQLPTGDFSYAAFASQGPLRPLGTSTFSGLSGDPVRLYEFSLFNLPNPTGYRAFDVPGPSEVTTGGMLPSEQLSSALAEGVTILGRVEEDRYLDGSSAHVSFRKDLLTGDVNADVSRLRTIGGAPYIVSGRTSSLAEGQFTALFTPAPQPGIPVGGALPSLGWSAADFMGQSGGSYLIVNRPRGPQGLFTAHPVAAGVALGTGANAWWSSTDPKSNGKRTGDFDAIELLRGEGCNPADPSAWFAEFKSVRADWFNLLNLQTPASFTKALGLSSGVYSVDTPVGLARTYLNLGTAAPTQDDLSSVAAALRTGAAVASTGPLLDVAVGTSGPGATVAGTNPSVTLTVNVWSASWVPVDEVRVVVNGTLAATAPFGATPASNGWTVDATDPRHWSQTFTVPMSSLTGGKDGWIVVEAGVPLATTGAYAAGTPWNKVMKGIYPVAVTNPIFVDVDGGGYTAPLP